MTKPHLAVVETIYETNASNIADMLRQAAETIESETEEDNRTEAIVAVQLMEDGDVQIYGWGALDSLKALGLLQLGVARHAHGMMPEDL